ncbi:hypothetical protein [Sphingomonas xinjiangensis]|uniref:Uncharacterized protein n=1 Tax=Sphingomonas xinjiangensis TaxID=643568 RepID=A0A840YJ14_9SPHN|nr:hypothetical protein [Sphingomonas xinjiangensis]MBB5710918.1 hypothetical protein [Sphingomonas xinjiangensis]
MVSAVDGASTRTAPPPPPAPPAPRTTVQLAQARLPSQVPTQPAQTPTGPSPEAQAARAKIDEHLDGTGFLNAQTHGDDQAIASTLASLSATDANAVVAGLQADGRLDDLASTITSSSVFTGNLSADERRQFITDVAGKLDGNNLAFLSRAFDTIGGDRGREGAGYVQELGQAVAAHASPQTKIDFVRALGPDTVNADGNTQFDNGLLSRTTHHGNPQAVAVGEVLSSMRGAQLETAFNTLDSGQQRAVFQAAIGETSSHFTGQGSPIQTPGYNTALFTELSQAFATMPSAHQKAQAFAVGAEVLRGERPPTTAVLTGQNASEPKRAMLEMANALGNIIDSDPSGIVNDLSQFRQPPAGSGDVATANGNALASYARTMLENDQGAKGRLGAQMARVAAGNVGQATPDAAFDHAVNGQYRTATGLGYFIGAASAAARSIDSDNAAQNQLIGNTLASGLTLLDKFGVASVAAAVAKDWVRTAQSSLAGAGGNHPTQALTDAALPTDAAGNDSSLSNSRSAFLSTLNFVSANARP